MAYHWMECLSMRYLVNITMQVLLVLWKPAHKLAKGFRDCGIVKYQWVPRYDQGEFTAYGLVCLPSLYV